MANKTEHKYHRQHCNKFSEDFKTVNIKIKKSWEKKSLKKNKSDRVIPPTSNYSMPFYYSQEEKLLPRTYYPLQNPATNPYPSSRPHGPHLTLQPGSQSRFPGQRLVVLLLCLAGFLCSFITHSPKCKI